MFANPGQAAMLSDIEREVAYTRHEIGRDAFAPVSYTHLDVYKRQVIESPRFIQPFIKIIFRQSFERLNSTMKGAAMPHLDTAQLI